MPPKSKVMAPIDRPLSRAYLREFTGWSTAYPPGISDPTSLRIMENMMINRDSSIRVRPGLRYVSYEESGAITEAVQQNMVGSHEPFFLNNGTKAYLFAVRENDATIGFRVLTTLPAYHSEMRVYPLTQTGIDFDVVGGAAVLNFTAATTYVKYLQIDNKIFALSNAGETMRLFTVGSDKSAKALSSITRPDWAIADKLTVVHPDAAWISGSIPTSTRKNLVPSPRMDALTAWQPSLQTEIVRVGTPTQTGAWSMQVTSAPERTNYMVNPLRQVSTFGFAGWALSTGMASHATNGLGLRCVLDPGAAGRIGWERAPNIDGLEAGEQYEFSCDFTGHTAASNFLIRIRWYNASAVAIGAAIDTAFGITVPTRRTVTLTAPAGAVTAVMYVGAEASSSGGCAVIFENAQCNKSSEAVTAFSGSSGANYFWTGAVDNSISVYHPPKDVQLNVEIDPIVVAAYVGSIYSRAGSVVRSNQSVILWKNAANAVLATTNGTAANNVVGSWTRFNATLSAPATTVKATYVHKIFAVPRGEMHYLDSAMFELGAAPGTYFDGGTTDTGLLQHSWAGTVDNSISIQDTYGAPTIPPAETKTVNTLISSTASANQYNFGFFYTFNNEVGESAASQVTTVRAQRSWQSWRWETANASGEPSGTATGDPTLCADQLAAYMPQAAFDAAVLQGATHWNLYMFTWSDQDPAPVTAVRVGQRELAAGAIHASLGWLRATPQMADAGVEAANIPKLQTRYNYSNPSRGGQGIVASDRMVMVYDPTAAAVIKWTSNLQGSYTDFSAARGGGYKTLTSGNLYIPACVKLWQNPQSVDTLTILCLGVDGRSTGYYMAPAQVASQSEATNIMGFEETTATPGTTSPYGVEVFNNALYHPLDEMLMKSTANNYNISHKSQTDQIKPSWRNLLNKHRIVSSEHDNRLYYLVHNPNGAELEDGCWGNEVWVLDGASEGGSWSRWLCQGQSLRKIEAEGQIVMSLVKPGGIFYFDDNYPYDDGVDLVNRLIYQTPIPFKIETNTQGANRAHDAWCRLQQCNITLGNFVGAMRYGVRGYDENGKPVDVSKVVTQATPVEDEKPFDLEDFLLIRRNMKEWFFYAESQPDTGLGDIIVHPTSGQISLVQYRYAPISVNVGYEYGSVETFAYGAAYDRFRLGQPPSTTDSGVPKPYIDTRRP